jgi:hypothetical protein
MAKVAKSTDSSSLAEVPEVCRGYRSDSHCCGSRLMLGWRPTTVKWGALVWPSAWQCVDRWMAGKIKGGPPWVDCWRT